MQRSTFILLPRTAATGQAILPAVSQSWVESESSICALEWPLLFINLKLTWKGPLAPQLPMSVRTPGFSDGQPLP